MRTSMMPPPAAPETDLLPSVTPDVLSMLDITDPDLFAAGLPGETVEQAGARHQAAADILDGRLAEIAHQTLTAQVLRGWAL